MIVKKIFGIASLLLCLVAVTFSIYVYCHLAQKMTRVHTLKFPMLLGGPDGSGPFQFLPKGTNLYYDQSYARSSGQISGAGTMRLDGAN